MMRVMTGWPHHCLPILLLCLCQGPGEQRLVYSFYQNSPVLEQNDKTFRSKEFSDDIRMTRMHQMNYSSSFHVG